MFLLKFEKEKNSIIKTHKNLNFIFYFFFQNNDKIVVNYCTSFCVIFFFGFKFVGGKNSVAK